MKWNQKFTTDWRIRENSEMFLKLNLAQFRAYNLLNWTKNRSNLLFWLQEKNKILLQIEITFPLIFFSIQKQIKRNIKFWVDISIKIILLLIQISNNSGMAKGRGFSLYPPPGAEKSWFIPPLESKIL